MNIIDAILWTGSWYLEYDVMRICNHKIMISYIYYYYWIWLNYYVYFAWRLFFLYLYLPFFPLAHISLLLAIFIWHSVGCVKRFKLQIDITWQSLSMYYIKIPCLYAFGWNTYMNVCIMVVIWCIASWWLMWCPYIRNTYKNKYNQCAFHKLFC